MICYYSSIVYRNKHIISLLSNVNKFYLMNKYGTKYEQELIANTTNCRTIYFT